MRSIILTVALLLVPATAATQTMPADLTEAVASRNKAAFSGDSETFGRYTTDDFVMIGADGIMHGKEERVALIKKRKPAPQPKISDERYRVYGDVVIRTWRQEDSGGVAHSTAVWVRQQGRWQVASHQQRYLKKL